MDLFSRGQKITLIFEKNSNFVEMACDVEKVYDDRLELVLPQYFMRYIECLQVGSKLMAKAFSKLGTVDFNSVIISSPLEDNFIIELDYNSLKLTAGENIAAIDAVETLEVNFENEKISLKTMEISSEKIKFHSSRKFAIKDILDCSLILQENYGIINFKLEISEIDEIYSDEYTAEFYSITEVAKQSLLYYMYVYMNNTD